jgi:hypothetical protein
LKNKIFFDNDVILYISIERGIDIKYSVTLIKMVEYGEYKGYTSSVIFTNIYYIQRKLQNHKTAINFLKKLRLLVTVLNVDDTIIQKALESCWEYFEDSA